MNRNFLFPYVEILRIYLYAYLRSGIHNALREQSRRKAVSYRFTDLLSYCRMDLRLSEYRPIRTQKNYGQKYLTTENENGQVLMLARSFAQFNFRSPALYRKTIGCIEYRSVAKNRPTLVGCDVGLLGKIYGSTRINVPPSVPATVGKSSFSMRPAQRQIMPSRRHKLPRSPEQ